MICAKFSEWKRQSEQVECIKESAPELFYKP